MRPEYDFSEGVRGKYARPQRQCKGCEQARHTVRDDGLCHWCYCEMHGITELSKPSVAQLAEHTVLNRGVAGS